MGGAGAVSPNEVDRFSYRTGRGELCMRLPAPTVLVMEYKGYSDECFVDFIETIWDTTLGRMSCAVQIFADTEQQTGYSSGFRIGLMKWSKRMVSRTDTYCLLVKSRWVAMGVAIVRTAVGGPAAHAEVTTNRSIFDAKLGEAVRRSLASARPDA
jgi:hypothetical protein